MIFSSAVSYNVFFFEETFSSPLYVACCFICPFRKMFKVTKRKKQFALRANVLFQLPLYVHDLFAKISFKVCVFQKYHKFLVPGAFYSIFFYQSTIITFSQTKTNNKRLKKFINKLLTKHYITLLPFVIFRQ